MPCACEQSYNEKSDVYSYGVVLWELFTGQVPWHDMSAMQVLPFFMLLSILRLADLRPSSKRQQWQSYCRL